MRRLRSVETPLPGLYRIEREVLSDRRGWFERLFCESELADILGRRRIVQANRSLTGERATVRGLHFQYPPAAEVKLVTCLRGEVFDVAVDLRAGSPTFLQWHGEVLTGENHHSLLIPEGFAHGFQTLSDDCEMLYFHTAAYDANREGGLDSLDPAIGIDWPLPVGRRSQRDSALPRVDEAFRGVELS